MDNSQGTKFESRAPAARTSLVFVHGGPGLSWHYFQPLFPHLSSAYNIVAYDQGTAMAARDFDGLAAELSAVISAEEIKGNEVVIVAHSYGSLVALNAIDRFKHRAALILISWIIDQSWLDEFTVQVPEYLDIERSLTLANKSVVSRSEQFKNQMLAYNSYYFPSGNLHLGTKWFHKLNYYPELALKIQSSVPNQFDAKIILTRISNRILSITGSEDRVVFPKHSEFAKSLNFSIENVRMKGVGHFSFLEAPADVSQLIANFLRRS